MDGNNLVAERETRVYVKMIGSLAKAQGVTNPKFLDVVRLSLESAFIKGQMQNVNTGPDSTSRRFGRTPGSNLPTMARRFLSRVPPPVRW